MHELAQVKALPELEQFRIKYLGTKGAIKNLMTLLSKVPREEKPAVGQRANVVRDDVNAKFEQKRSELGTPVSAVQVDVTERDAPGTRPKAHPDAGG